MRGSLTPVISLFAIAIAVVSSLSAMAISDRSAQYDEPQVASISSLSTHSPIRIEGDAQFTAANGVVGGSGTESDPYIIEGWSIGPTSGDRIAIFHTTAHFVIRNCNLYGPGGMAGIRLAELNNAELSNNTMSADSTGIILMLTSNIVVSGNKISGCLYNGIYACLSHDCLIYGNTVSNDKRGICLDRCYDNLIINNGIISNSEAQALDDSGNNRWNGSYSQGGNYWSDWTSPDLLSGEGQDLPGADGIVDLPYDAIKWNGGARDCYPLVDFSIRPLPPPPAANDTVEPGEEAPVNCTIDFDPDKLEVSSGGTWVTVYIELAQGYDPASINLSTIRMNEVLTAEGPSGMGDYDSDGVPDLMVKFDRSEFVALLNVPPGEKSEFTVTLSGKLTDGSDFSGTDVITAMNMAGKLNGGSDYGVSDNGTATDMPPAQHGKRMKGGLDVTTPAGASIEGAGSEAAAPLALMIGLIGLIALPLLAKKRRTRLQ